MDMPNMNITDNFGRISSAQDEAQAGPRTIFSCDTACVCERLLYNKGMLTRACTAETHRATVTEADLSYVGSITVDAALLEASGIKPFQYVNITKLANGAFWQTYVTPGKRGKGDICLNGPPARHFQPGDEIIIPAGLRKAKERRS
jgi:L-aspartate-alpha-decarboxylase